MRPPETVLIPAGPFTMGNDSQSGRYAGRPDERPAHRVTLDAFRLAVLPVTNEDYAAFLQATSNGPAGGHPEPRFWRDPAFSRPRQPVVGVSWFDAVAYCDWLTEALGDTYRLPTEAEWEKAALGGEVGRAYPWGDACWDGSDGSFPMDATWDVGTAPPNGYGLIDIGFNVHEWCSDWYDPRYYHSSPEHNPQGPPEGVRKASRGGAWRHRIKICRCAARSSIPPDYQYNDYGFRVVRC